MLVGMYDGSLSQSLIDTTQFFKTPNLPITAVYLDGSQSWSNGMLSSWYIDQCVGATQAEITVPMLIGPRLGGTRSATLSAALTTAGPITSIPVEALPAEITCWTGWLVSGSDTPTI